MKKLNLLLVFLLANSIIYAQDYWKKVSAPGRQDLLCISFGSSSTGYIGGIDSTLLKTTDGGKTWTPLHHTGIEYESYSLDLVDVDFVSADTGYVVLSSRSRPDVNGTMYKTRDGGHTWVKLEKIWTSVYQALFFDEKNGFAIGVTPFGGPTLNKLERGVWSPVRYLGVGTSYQATALDFYNTSTGIIGGDYGYVYLTFDAGVTWDTVKTNVNDRINAIRYIDENTIVAASSNMMTLLISKDKGASWNFDVHSGTFYYPEMKGMALSARDSLISVGKSATTGKGLIYYFDPSTPWMDIAEAEQWLNNITMRTDSVAYIVGDSGLILSNDDEKLAIAEKTTLQALLRVYPNPSDGRFTAVLPVACQLLVYDAQGKVVFRDHKPSTVHHADLRGLASGAYILEAVSEEGDRAYHQLQLR